MTPEFMGALVAAFGTLMLAVVAWLTAKVQTNTAAVRTHQDVLTALTRAVGTRTEGNVRAGTGAESRTVTPLWNQLSDPSSTGELPPQRFNDCGEECCAEVIYHQHGVEVQADYLRAELRGSVGTGVTDGAALVRILARNNVGAAAESVPSAAVAKRVQTVVGAGGQVIALGNFVSPAILHWVLITRADANGCGANDPWGGVRRTWTWPQFGLAYAGELVAITRQPDAA